MVQRLKHFIFAAVDSFFFLFFFSPCFCFWSFCSNATLCILFDKQLDCLTDLIITLSISALIGSPSFTTPSYTICWATNNWYYTFTSRSNSFTEKPDSTLAFPWDNMIYSYTISSSSQNLGYIRKIRHKNSSTLSLLKSNFSIFSMALLLLIKCVYCTFAQSATLADINSESNSVSRSFLNLLTNNSSEIPLICVGEKLDRCSVNAYLIGDFSANFDKSLENGFSH